MGRRVKSKEHIQRSRLAPEAIMSLSGNSCELAADACVSAPVTGAICLRVAPQGMGRPAGNLPGLEGGVENLEHLEKINVCTLD